MRFFSSVRLHHILYIFTFFANKLIQAQIPTSQPQFPFPNLQPNFPQTPISPIVPSPTTFDNPYHGVNLVPFGPDAGDEEIFPGMLDPGQTVNLHMFFPFYGGLYNYSIISVNGYIGFAHILNQGPVLNVGVESTDWPRQPDPAMIAPWLCKQQISQDNFPGLKAGVFYRLILRQSLFSERTTESLTEMPNFFNQPASKACRGSAEPYVHCNEQTDLFLEQMMQWLQEGVAGASVFRADAALVVTWYNTAPGISGSIDTELNQLSTYQAIWLTDQPGRLSYVIFNYDKIGFDANDFHMNSRNGRCRALFNGGNHTGTVPVDPTQSYKHSPKVLAQRSGVPHIVRGRYMFRVDDVVRPCGCSNKTAGTYPMTIYPNIVNMFGETHVDVNALCLDPAQTYILMIEQRETATCIVLNSAIARCILPRVFDWGTKTVYFQAQPGNLNAQDDKAFVGYIYFVPPTIDPMRLDIGNVYNWFQNPLPFPVMPISWYPRNFTNPDLIFNERIFQISNEAIYNVQLGLYVIGYREWQDLKLRKFRPEYRTICRLATFANRNDYEYRWKPQEERINVNQVEQWYLSEYERSQVLYTYRFGYMKLAPVRSDDSSGINLHPGLTSSPISLHWLWPLTKTEFDFQAPQPNFSTRSNEEAKVIFVEEKATKMCHDWYAEDGAQYNFIRYTETNASCPCVESQAQLDLGRFMPHPRCSQVFRDVSCSTVIGSQNCYISAENVYTSYYAGEGQQFNAKNTAPFLTHYGQMCCYDNEGKLMQSTYQPVIKVIEQTPYNPGYPTRAYEFGTYPYMGQYEVPGFSTFYHDYMPYFFCCKYAKFRCQLFYWRRPTSGCQDYQPSATGYVQGAGSFTTISNEKFIFDQPGVFTFLYISQTPVNPEVKIQIRLERYPNRRVDFGALGRSLPQAELVQPTNATVVTGIALEATGTDRVVIVVRKDTRRFRYRTSIIVGNILRYFDNMKLQKFRGVMIYVNNVEYGQSEIYVILEEAQIGVRIRESYALDITRLSMYQESMGLFDIEIGVPPRYGVRPNGQENLARSSQFTQSFNAPRIYGLMYPNLDGTTVNGPLTLSDVNPIQLTEQLIARYLVSGNGAGANTNNNSPNENMFRTSSEFDRKFEVFPEAALKTLPIYKTAEKFNNWPYAFVPKSGPAVVRLLEMCRNLQEQPRRNLQIQQEIFQLYGATRCPNNPTEIVSICGDDIPCLNDFSMLNSKILGDQALNSWNTFTTERQIGTRKYNSCGAIMLEYPSYMLKTPSTASAYLEGDVASFSCYQTHWIKGDYEYKCSERIDYNHPNMISYQWNKGWQPWCRSRQKDNLYQWLTGIFSTIGIIMAIASIFLTFWCIKQKRRAENEDEESVSKSRDQKYSSFGREGSIPSIDHSLRQAYANLHESPPYRINRQNIIHEEEYSLSDGLRSRSGVPSSILLGLKTSV